MQLLQISGRHDLTANDAGLVLAALPHLFTPVQVFFHAAPVKCVTGLSRRAG